MIDVQSLAQRIQIHVTSQDYAISDLTPVVQKLCEAMTELQNKYNDLEKRVKRG
jgi:hypothetical protein